MNKKLFCIFASCLTAISMLFGCAVFARTVEPAGGETAAESSGDAGNTGDSWAESAASAEASAESAAEPAEAAEDASDSSGDSSNSAGDSAAAMREAGYGDILDFDWAGYYRGMSEKIANGEKISVEDALPEAYLQLFEMLVNSPDNTVKEEGVTVDYVSSGNELISKSILSADLDEAAVNEKVETKKALYSSDFY